MQTALITGGTGFLGSKIVKKFLSNNYRVLVLVRQNSSFKRLEDVVDHPNLIKIRADDVDFENILREHKVRGAIHTATCYGRNNETWSEVAESNLLLPLRLLVAGEKSGVECFINTDTFFNENIYNITSSFSV